MSEEKGIERRTCLRFEIPGSTISYKIEKMLPAPQGKYGEEFCPTLDISRGGMRFVSQSPIKINQRITMKISVPGERIPLSIKGRVRWAAANAGKSYKYQIGVQFNPYGEKKGQNLPGSLVKIIALEQKFAPVGDSSQQSSDSETGHFEIDG